jgi:hypothetical protein
VDERKTVLIVDQDGADRERIGRWFDRAGFRVLSCPGPTGPDFTCLGGRGGPCPLVSDADLVVLDLWLQSDSMMEGTSSLELLMYYIGTGKPIVAISDGPDPSRLFVEERLALMDRPLDRRELLETAQGMLGKDALSSGASGP